MGAIRRQIVWLAAAVVMTGAGYSAGYSLWRHPPATVSRAIPDAPQEVPGGPAALPEFAEDA